MSKEEITALAREYAEEATKADASDPNLSDSDLNGIKRDVTEYAEEILRFLLRRYALVEKEKLKAIRFRKVYSAEDVRSKFTEECLIDALFPEIAKEVES